MFVLFLNSSRKVFPNRSLGEIVRVERQGGSERDEKWNDREIQIC